MFVVIALVVVFTESMPGEIVPCASVCALVLLFLRWIAGFAFFTLAKTCAVVVAGIMGAILLAIIN